MSGALDGTRVIDFGQYLAGPLAALRFADQGAEVIRVDPPGGPRWRHPANAVLPGGKRSIVLDLKRSNEAALAITVFGRGEAIPEVIAVQHGTTERRRRWPASYCWSAAFRLDTPEQVFHRVCGPLGPYLAYMPDGEVGERRYWIDGIAYRVFNGHPEIETLRRPAPDANGVES